MIHVLFSISIIIFSLKQSLEQSDSIPKKFCVSLSSMQYFTFDDLPGNALSF